MKNSTNFPTIMHNSKLKKKKSKLETQNWHDGTSEIVGGQSKEGNTTRFTMIMAKTTPIGLHSCMFLYLKPCILAI